MEVNTGDIQTKSPKRDFLASIFFCWIYPIVKLGSRRELELKDVYKVHEKESTFYLGKSLLRIWKEESASRISYRPSLSRVILRRFKYEFLLIITLLIISLTVFQIAQCVALGYLLVALDGNPKGTTVLSLGGVLLFFTCAYTLVVHPTMLTAEVLGMKIRVSLSALIYEKALRLTQKSLATSGIGQITNFLSNELNRCDRFATNISLMAAAPFQLATATYFLYKFCGPSCFAGISLLLLLAPIQGCLGIMFGRLRSQIGARTESRVSLMNEVVNGMLTLKMFTWEKPFMEQVTEVRNQELRLLRRKTILDFFNRGFSFVSSKITVLLTFITYVLTGNELQAAQAFATLALFNAIRLPTTHFFPIGFMGLSEIRASLDKIKEFLLLDEQDLLDVTKCGDFSFIQQKLGHGISATKLCTSWSTTVKFLLTDIDVEVGSGQLVVVMGPVGSGKTTLLYSLLQELPADFGSIDRYGKIAYVPQVPWLFPGTIRENIVFGIGFNEPWYQEVLEACSLHLDISSFPHGDATYVGDQGMMLSGGQKARITLARAVYSNANIYLLDDPLSSVDQRVGRHIFEKCIMGLLKKKAVILVTHKLEFIEPAKEIIMLSNGRIIGRGSHAELVESNKIIPRTGDDQDRIDILDELNSQHKGTTAFNKVFGFSNAYDDMIEEEQDQTKLIKQDYGTFGKMASNMEQRSKGLVSFSVYAGYYASGKGFLFSMLLLTSVLTQVFFSGTDYWLKIWISTDAHYERGPKYSTDTDVNNTVTIGLLPFADTDDSYMLVYGLLVAGLTIFSIVRLQLLARICMKASFTLHSNLLSKVFSAPMRFFEVNTFGRVLNRFVNDVGVMDEYVPLLSSIPVMVLLEVLGAMVVIGITNPWTFAPAILLTLLFYYFRKIYLWASFSIKRLETVYRSPVFGHVSTSLHGLTTIRAYGRISNFEDQFYTIQDRHTSTFYLSRAAARWLAISLDWITNAYIVFIVVTFYFISPDGSQVGLAISSAFGLVSEFALAVTDSLLLENQLISVERIMEYSQIESEAPSNIPGQKPPVSWPSNGRVELDQVSVRYGNDMPALQNITCTFYGGEKVGIVGRTGSGKSTLIAAIFRIVEPSSGKIFIDGLDTSKLGLYDLRSKISVIPQNPLLFTGTLRKNLDPFEHFTDTSLLECLDAVHLKHRFFETGLDSAISGNGSNLSQGEKQLICLARAILVRTNILVLDEATANVDTETDNLIHEIVKNKFRNTTVLTIAHRLDTIMGSDRVLVLDEGRLVEYDEPLRLLEKQGALYKLVETAGRSQADYLIQLASKAGQQSGKLNTKDS